MPDAAVQQPDGQIRSGIPLPCTHRMQGGPAQDAHHGGSGARGVRCIPRCLDADHVNEAKGPRTSPSRPESTAAPTDWYAADYLLPARGLSACRTGLFFVIDLCD